jgi:hypothetical protein
MSINVHDALDRGMEAYNARVCDGALAGGVVHAPL